MAAESTAAGGTEKRDRASSVASLMVLKTISNGLQVKMKTAPFASYTCGCTDGNAKSLDWRIIAADDDNGDEEHICCRAFNKGDDLNKLLAQSVNSCTKAVVLVNVRDDFMVEPNLWPKEGNLPVLLLRNSDGNHLLSALEGHIQVWGKVDLESSAPRTPTLQKAADSASTRPSSAKKEETKAEVKVDGKQAPPTQKTVESPLRRLKRGNSRKQIDAESKVDLHGEIKKLLPIVMTEDSVAFAKAMSIFQRYERMPRTDGNHGELLKKILKNIATTFEKDFPFYLVLAHRINSHPAIYRGDEGSKFVSACIDRLEALGPLQYTSGLNGFFRRGDFSVMAVEPQVDNICAFQLLAKACYDLAALSSKLHSERRSSEQLIYKRMLWMCAALKSQSHYEEAVMKTNWQPVWEQNVLQLLKGTSFSPDVISDLRRGMNLTNLLKLPPAMMLTTDQMIKLVTQDDRARTFSNLTNYIDVMNGYISETTHVLQMSAKLREFYDSWLKESYSTNAIALSADGTINGAVMEGLIFVEKLNEILVQRRPKKELCEEDDEEIFKWLLLLLQMIDMTTVDSIEQLVKFLNGRIVTRQREKLFNEVVKKARTQFRQLTIEVFLLLYRRFTFWPPNFVEEYYAGYKMLHLETLSVTVFLTDIIGRLELAMTIHEYSGIGNLIRAVGQIYTAEGHCQDFITDLLKMNVPKLPKDNGENLQLTSDIRRILFDYIESNALGNVLSRLIHENSTNEQQNYFFQSHILAVAKKLNKTARSEMVTVTHLDEATSDTGIKAKREDTDSTQSIEPPPTNGSVEPPSNGSVEPPSNGSVEPPSNGSVEPSSNGSGSVKPPSNGSDEPLGNGNVEPTSNGSGSVKPLGTGNAESIGNVSCNGSPGSENVVPLTGNSTEVP